MKRGKNEVDVDFFVDLNGKEFQKKLYKYYTQGFARCDKHGNTEKIQAKCHPWMKDMLAEIREKTGRWKTESEQIRSLVMVGYHVIEACDNSILGKEFLQKLKRFLDIESMISRRQHEEDFLDRGKKAFKDLNASPRFDLDEFIDKVEDMARSAGFDIKCRDSNPPRTD